VISFRQRIQGTSLTQMESSSHSQPVRFGSFEVDLRAGELRKEGSKIKLQDQPFQILALLLERPGQVVTREELQSRLWPSDTFVDFDQGLNKAINKLREALGDSADKPHFIETLAKRGYRFLPDLNESSRSIRSLLVLPLENLSRDPEQEYFADGLTEELITRLARISALRVLSRTTAMYYKGVRKPLSEIARELNIDAVVEGSVFRSGDRFRISAQMIHAPTDTHLWAESYERNLRDVLTLQSEVTQAIAREVEAKVSPQEQAQLARSRQVDPEVYESYLKGRYYWDKRTAEGLRKGSEYFQKAIEKDPTYAAAYAGLADCADRAGLWGFVPPELGAGRARTVARKALEFDDTLSEAHSALGSALLHYEWDYLASENEFRRAISLNTSYATAHQWYGHCLAAMGRVDESLMETKQALRLDPLSPIISVSHAFVCWFAGQWDQAVEHCETALELHPNYLGLVWALANAYQGKGNFEQAIQERERAVKLSAGAPMFVAELGQSYAAAGQSDEALRILEQLRELSKLRYVMAYWVALIHAGLKDRDETFRWLAKAYEERSAHLAYVKVDPRFDSLHSETRFSALLRRMNFPP
jgi:TolB-like protein/Flp pilus assembly protein TadD